MQSGGKANAGEAYLGQKMERAATYTVDRSRVTLVLVG
jgi:hypothetical protein